MAMEALLGADSFSLVDDEVTFRRRAGAGSPAVVWHGRLNDWLVRDGAGFWRIVADESWTVDHRLTGAEGTLA